MGKILVGTTSWTERTLIDSGLFYPPTVKSPEDRLRYYATKFAVSEVDSTYYALPTEEEAQIWADRTPKKFTFHIKAFRFFTGHQTSTSVLPKDIREAIGRAEKNNVSYKDLPAELTEELWNRFRSALAPLQNAGKLGAILLQFPPWFIPNRDAYAYVLACAEKLKGMHVAFEFRNKIWFDKERRKRVLRFLQEHSLVHVVVDEPQGFRTSMPSVWEATSPSFAIVRFHGRNRETWEKKALASAAERFTYLYSQAELQELAASLKKLSEDVRETHALFTNCYRDYGPRNAMDFQHLLNGAAKHSIASAVVRELRSAHAEHLNQPSGNELASDLAEMQAIGNAFAHRAIT